MIRYIQIVSEKALRNKHDLTLELFSNPLTC